jgi:DNA repair protein RadC
MSIRDWPILERPRERLLQRGPSALSDAELLAALIGHGSRGKDAISLGRELIAISGGLHRLLSDATSLSKVAGIGPAKRARLLAAFELARRAMGEQLMALPTLSNPRDSGQYLSARLRHLTQEVFACLYLDNHHRVIAFEELFRGTVDGASVHPREVVRACLEHNACAVILAHNHPSGVAEPSAADRAITIQLRDVLNVMGVRVLDHLVIGSGDPVSMAERGMI